MQFSNIKIGHGYDVHRLVPDRKLILCGVEIESELGLLGHSDADVAVHAIMDSILGAMALGDIGKLFPDTDMKYKNADSVKLLTEVVAIMEENSYKIGNIDVTIIAEKPKLKSYIQQMRQRMAKALHTDLENVSIKATTEEGLGLAGQGIGANAVCLLVK